MNNNKGASAPITEPVSTFVALLAEDPELMHAWFNGPMTHRQREQVQAIARRARADSNRQRKIFTVTKSRTK